MCTQFGVTSCQPLERKGRHTLPLPEPKELYEKCFGATLDGRHPMCTCYCEPKPSTFIVKWPKPNKRPMQCSKACPPVDYCEPGTFYAERPKNYMALNYPCQYCPPPCCDRPCCKHYTGESKRICCYDDPCVAHCYDHPVGMKPSGRYGRPIFKGLMEKNIGHCPVCP